MRHGLSMAMFQSAPRSRDRGDPGTGTIWKAGMRFNPRPGHATGATGITGEEQAVIGCFNPRPGHATGAT